jgi:hypothetical protein
MLIALIGGGITGFFLNMEFRIRPSASAAMPRSVEVSIVVRRMRYRNVKGNQEPVRFSTPGIVDITPPEAIPASAPASGAR